MVVVFRVAEIFFGLSPHLREEDEQGNHVRNNDQTHSNVLDAPDEIDFTQGTDEAQEGENVFYDVRDFITEGIRKALGSIPPLAHQSRKAEDEQS